MQGSQVPSRARRWPPALFLLSADIAAVICDTPQKASTLIENMEKGLTPGLKMIILMDPFEDDLKERAEKCGIEILSLFDAEVCALNSTSGLKAGLTPGDIHSGHLHESTGCCLPAVAGDESMRLMLWSFENNVPKMIQKPCQRRGSVANGNRLLSRGSIHTDRYIEVLESGCRVCIPALHLLGDLRQGAPRLPLPLSKMRLK